MTELESTIARVIREVKDPDFAARLIVQLVPSMMGKLGGRPRSVGKGDENGLQTPSKPLLEPSNSPSPVPSDQDPDPEENPSDSSAELERPTQADTSPIVFVLPMTAGRKFEVRESYAAKLRELYPGLDVRQQLMRLADWLERNPRKQNAKVRGLKARIAYWFSGEQDKAGRGIPSAPGAFPRQTLPPVHTPNTYKPSTCSFHDDRPDEVRRDAGPDWCVTCKRQRAARDRRGEPTSVSDLFANAKP